VKKLFQICKATLIGGIFFLVPLVLLLMVLGKALTFLQKISKPLTKPLDHWHVGGVAMHEIIAVLLLLLACFAAGFIARTAMAKKLVSQIENKILVHFPGYNVIKTVMGDHTADLKNKGDLKIVLAQTDSGWQMAFLIEAISEDVFAVFIPNAPDLFSGAVVYAEKDKIKFIDISRKDAIASIRRMGVGSALVLKGKI
jgi:uncharacterized membrane protein